MELLKVFKTANHPGNILETIMNLKYDFSIYLHLLPKNKFHIHSKQHISKYKEETVETDCLAPHFIMCKCKIGDG